MTARVFSAQKKRHWGLPRGKWVRVIPENSLIHETVKLSGQPVTQPKVYTEEKWVRYSPAPAQAAPIHLMAVAETPEPLVRSQARR